METKDILDLSFKAGTVIFAAITVWKALKELRDNHEQRRNDLKWKQAEAAKNLIDAWMGNKEAFSFCRMIEYENRSFINEEGNEFHCNVGLIIKALNNDAKEIINSVDADERYIRDTCDAFLYYTELMNQGLESNLYLLKNLIFPLRYYLQRMNQKGLYDTVINYASRNGFRGSINLFNELHILDNK